MKAGIITQARMTSTRLPAKILKEAGGRSLLAWHVERLQWSQLPVFIATTVNATDEPVVSFAAAANIPVFRGDEHNVLERFYGCAAQYELDIIVRVTSDCPLIDGYVIQQAVEQYRKENNPFLYLSNTQERTYPRGLDFEIFSRQMLEMAYGEADSIAEKEHVTPFFYKTHATDFRLKNIKRKSDASQLRITVDTAEDFELVKILIEQYHAQNLSAEELIHLLEQNPELLAINAHVEQKKA
ncbi:cytidylyltransferase domain-containing protein [Nafulsella turpanensis]|uniref:cytidylyltransferase domain-containing protein n=1 Tax=Nafulsella turpanensis TaxID=1265690 RepID=UPI000346443C|nr:glycosyltransferase family protein [Nafulsella turpanensis]